MAVRSWSRIGFSHWYLPPNQSLVRKHPGVKKQNGILLILKEPWQMENIATIPGHFANLNENVLQQQQLKLTRKSPEQHPYPTVSRLLFPSFFPHHVTLVSLFMGSHYLRFSTILELKSDNTNFALMRIEKPTRCELDDRMTSAQKRATTVKKAVWTTCERLKLGGTNWGNQAHGSVAPNSNEFLLQCQIGVCVNLQPVCHPSAVEILPTEEQTLLQPLKTEATMRSSPGRMAFTRRQRGLNLHNALSTLLRSITSSYGPLPTSYLYICAQNGRE